MARRPVFLPTPGSGLVTQADVEFEWSAGFAVSQKQKSIAALHEAARTAGVASSPLEISTKSAQRLGFALSAFNLVVRSSHHGTMALESAFQGSKVFARAGQHPAWYELAARDAKRASAQLASDRVIAFSFEGTEWPTEPTTAFYDWLYISAVVAAVEESSISLDDLRSFDGFTDIEFNPARSINCQARSCALLVALSTDRDLAGLIQEPLDFRELLRSHRYGTAPDAKPQQLDLL